MICAAAPGRDACRVSGTHVGQQKNKQNTFSYFLNSQGDSGGPLIIQATPNSRWIQVGIVSFGIGKWLSCLHGVVAIAHYGNNTGVAYTIQVAQERNIRAFSPECQHSDSGLD